MIAGRVSPLPAEEGVYHRLAIGSCDESTFPMGEIHALAPGHPSPVAADRLLEAFVGGRETQWRQKAINDDSVLSVDAIGHAKFRAAAWSRGECVRVTVDIGVSARNHAITNPAR